MPDAELPRIAICGPGRAGQALGRAMARGGVPLVGFLGRNRARAAAAVAFVGSGTVWELDQVDRRFFAGVDALLLAVQDDELAGAVAEWRRLVVARTGDPDLLVFHCSGAHDLSVLDPLRDVGVSVGSLHPLCPLPDPEVGFANLAGQPGVIEAEDATAAVLTAVAGAAGLVPVRMTGGDRLLYHAACVLAANGLTALFAAAQELFAAAMPGQDVSALPGALMRAALDTCHRHGPTQALSGPVVRGDVALVRRQLDALAARDAAAGLASGASAEVYRSLMLGAVALAEQRGDFSEAGGAAMRQVLADG